MLRLVLMLTYGNYDQLSSSQYTGIPDSDSLIVFLTALALVDVLP